MKVDMTQVVTNLEGEAYKDGDKDQTIRPLIVQALTYLGEDNKDMSGEERYKHYQIALKVSEKEDVVDLTAEEITLIKGLVGKLFLPIVVGRVYDALEGVG